MSFSLTPYHVPLLLSAVVVGLLAFTAWRQRRSAVARDFFRIQLLGVFWVAIYALDVATDQIPLKIFLQAIRVPVISAMPVVGLSLALHYVGKGSWVSGKVTAALLVPALLTTALALTSRYHSLWRVDYRLLEGTPLPIVVSTPGVAHWANFLWGYALLALIIILLIRAVGDAPSLFTHRAALMLGGLAISLVPHVLFEIGVSPIPGYNLAPSLFGVSGLLFFYGTLRHRILEVIPIARSRVVDELRDTVLVLNGRNLVVDANRAARQTLGLPIEQVIGRPAGELFALLGVPFERLRGRGDVHEELVIGDGAARRVLDVSIVPVERRRRGRTRGRIVMIRDITDRELAREALRTTAALEAQREAEERTRREIAELLHGRVQTQLLLLNLKLGELEQRWPQAPPPAKALVAEVRQKLDHVREREVRAASHRLYPTMLELGLTPALHMLAEGYEPHLVVLIESSARFARLDSPLDNHLPMPLRETAYRVIEEALGNVQKHAGATSVTISLSLESGHAVIQVEDNGHGVDPARVKPGLGLRTIAARVGNLGGTWRLTGAPAKGATLTVELPLEHAAVNASLPARYSPPAYLLGENRLAEIISTK